MALKSVINEGDVEFRDMLLHDIDKMRRNKELVDVTLICGDLIYPAHKIILSCASDYFRVMFGGNFPESNQKVVELHDIEAESLQNVLDFFYTSVIKLNLENVYEIFAISSFLQSERLSEICVEFFIKSMNPFNCLGFRNFAKKQNSIQLLHATEDYIFSHFQAVVQSNEFVHMSHSQIISIMSKDELYMHSDDIVLKGLIRWAEYKPEKRLNHLSSLLHVIHPACVSAEVARSLPLPPDTESAETVSQWRMEVINSANNMEWNIFVMDKMGKEASLMRYDLNFEHTIELKPLPNPAFAVSLTHHKNILYAQGGSFKRSKTDSYYYNIYRDQWYNLTSLLEPRSHHRSLILKDYLYAMGGNTLEGTTYTVECLSLVTNHAMLLPRMKRARGSMGAVIYNNAIYVMGGETDHRSLNSMETFDPREGQWQDLPSMHDVKSYCSSAVIDDNIYCCEGLGSCMERFDCRAQRWVTIDFWEEREFYEIFAVDNKLYSIYGDGIARYDVENVKWTKVYTFPQARDWDTALGLTMSNYRF